MSFKKLCECLSYTCREVIVMEDDDYVQGHVHIAKSCPHGKESTDVLVEERETYNVYLEGK